MAADDPSGARSGPIVLRIKLRYDTVEAMVERFAPNVGKSGLFLPTKAIQPIGTQVKFELRILDDTPVLVGLGRVVATREPDPARPKAPFGIAIELMRVSREGGEMIKRMLGARRALGLPVVGIPTPEDLDAVPRVVDAMSGPVVVSGPVPAVMTAPLAQSGPIVAAAAPLAPEPPRPKRPRVADLIAQAQSGPVAMPAMPELDAEVDIARALARARVLAGGDVDAELEALREQVSVPTEISIEAASAELARQLGGAAVRKKDRGVVPGWAPPPAVEAKESLPSPVSSLQPEAESAAPIAPEAAVTAVGEPDPDDKPDVYAAAEVELTTDPSLPVVPRAVLLEEEPEPEPEEEHLDSVDMEPLDEQEHTQIGDLPVDPAAFQHHAYATVPQAPADLEERLDQHLAEAEEDVERELEEMQHTAFGASPFPAAEPEYEVEPVDPAELAAAGYGEEAAASAEAAAAVDIEEIDDVDVIDESDLELEEDPVAEPPPPRADAPQFELPDESAFVSAAHAAEPYEADFAARLDLSDSAEFDRDAAREFDEAMPPRQRSDDDLEVALEALDVDLDDLSIPRRGFDPGSGRVAAPAKSSGSGRISQLVAKSGSGPVQTPRSKAPVRAQPRLPTDDGVLIDFDDDDE